MSKIIVLGEALIDIFADEGVPLRDAKILHPSPGGAPANVAVALARLGAEVSFIGKVGADEYGTYLIDLLAKEGVDTSYFVADPREPTMLAIVATPSPTEQHFALYTGASALLRPEELPQAVIVTADVFVFGSVTLASASGDAAMKAGQWARSAGKHVVFDVNLRPALWPDLEVARQTIEECVTLANVVKLNDTELEFLTGFKDPARGSDLILQRDVQLCCVSLGAAGYFFNNGNVTGHVPGFSVTVRDTTGSGDASVAGLAYQLSKLNRQIAKLDYADLYSAITFANACGALAATQLGAMSASPRLADVERLLQTVVWGS